MTNLKHLMVERGMTQSEVAAKAHVTQNTVSTACNGKRMSKPATLAKIAEAVGWEGDPRALVAEHDEGSAATLRNVVKSQAEAIAHLKDALVALVVDGDKTKAMACLLMSEVSIND